jgi:hypothetical protein
MFSVLDASYLGLLDRLLKLQHQINYNYGVYQSMLCSVFYVLCSTFYLLFPTFHLLFSFFYLLFSKFYVLLSIFYFLLSIFFFLSSIFYFLSSIYYSNNVSDPGKDKIFLSCCSYER